jgi:triacylglycerol lipase
MERYLVGMIRKTLMAAAIAAGLLFPSCASRSKAIESAGLIGGRCSTRFPILLVHGIMMRDDYPISYWGRIPKALAAEGARVYLANNDAWGSIEDNADYLCARVDEILAETGARKVNIIAHSKGGLDSRYLISSLGRGDRIASLTTLNSPHRGAPIATLVLGELPVLNETTGLIIDLAYSAYLRDGNPNVKRATSQLAPESMAVFNQRNLDDPRVYYQSWTSAIDGQYPMPAFAFMYGLTASQGGPNDGVVPVDSAEWGNYRGLIFPGSEMSHSDVCDYHVFSYQGVPDVLPFYLDMVADLKARGF